MSKSVLVMDTPEGCYHCMLGYFGLSGTDYCLMYRENRKVENIDIHTERPDWCPLIPVPEQHIPDVNEIQEFSDKSDNFGAEAIVGYYTGWNACLDTLEEKET